jgi:hypothetical protein
LVIDCFRRIHIRNRRLLKQAYLPGSSALNQLLFEVPPKQAIVSFNAGSNLAGLSQIIKYTIMQPADVSPGRFAEWMILAHIH